VSTTTALPARTRNPLERFLGLFADVRPGEGTTVVLLMLNVFLLLCCYYIIKPVRESLEALYEMDYVEVAPVEGEGRGKKRKASEMDVNPNVALVPFNRKNEYNVQSTLFHLAQTGQFVSGLRRSFPLLPSIGVAIEF